MSLKKLHSFVVNVKKEVSKTETRTENGKEISETSKVKENVPHTIILKSPTRRDKQSLSVFYTVKYNQGLEMGMMPKAVLVQKFLKDPDSPLSQDDDKNITECYTKLESLQNDLVRLNSLDDTPENTTRKGKVYSEFLTTQKKIMDIETAYRSLFAHTTESYAQNQALSWLVLHLTYIQVGDGEPYPMFPGNSFKDKEDILFDLEDKEDELYFSSLERLSMYASLYFSGGASKPEDFEKIEKEYEAQLKTEKELDEIESKPEEIETEAETQDKASTDSEKQKEVVGE